ncbi:Aminotransferase class V-fold PLP-dependent enzyme OS=Streptomyces alboniger OX=132473 GN=CP975_12495 PE=3 SV=1 [Streptomyces alboniger]
MRSHLLNDTTAEQLIERRLIDWTAERLGLGPDVGGVFTGDGREAGLRALLLARERAGDRDPATLRILTSEDGCADLRETAGQLGLGEAAVVAVRTGRDGRMRTVALAGELERCAREGLFPLAVVAGVGTPGFGAVDPLPEIAALCARYGGWLHVNAAYGCGLLAARRNRHLLDGVEHADSVTVHYDQASLQAVEAAALLVRDGTAVTPLAAAATRHPDVLKLWTTLQVLGADGIGALFDEACERATAAWRLLVTDPRFDVVAEPRLTTLVFRHIPAWICAPSAIDRANRYARKALSAAGCEAVGGITAGGRQYLTLTLLDPGTTTAEVAAVLDRVAGHAEQYLGERLVRAS